MESERKVPIRMINLKDMPDDIKLAYIYLGQLDKMQAGDEWPAGSITYRSAIWMEMPEDARPAGDDPVTRSSMIELLQEYISRNS